MNQKEMENLVQAHRFRRLFLQHRRKFSDAQLAFLEDKARRQFPKSRVLAEPASSLRESYSNEVRQLAKRL